LWVVDITSSKEHLFIATKHNGVVVYDGQKFFRITQEDGLPINYVETIAIENDSVIWVGSKKGVSKVHVNFKNEEVHVFNINSSNGLISDEVSDICINNKQAWVGTNAGMSFFDTDKSFENELPPPVFLEVISVNGIPQSNFKSQIFPHTSQVFDFSFFGINYKSRVPLTYRYRLIGLDSTWHETKGREVSYSLPNGKYRFEALAQNNSGIWSKKPAVFEFEIQTPYWKQLWFLLALTFLFLGIVALVIQYRINRIKEKNRIKLQMAESQQIALNAQLKPHFIFNALNSIHNYIRKNDREASGKYLLLFSKLIRQILMNSNKPVVTIEEEVSLLQKYLEIEKLRFKDRMNYNIIIDPKIDVSRLKIPTQLVQPYLENAIWHGIMNKETSGSITFELKLESAKMRCIIVDNGIGREAAMGFKSDNYHQSSGMVISEKRLKLIEATLKKKVEITITDLKDAAGKATGTKVELVFPIIE
jgi:sensor histidine kinase YesM